MATWLEQYRQSIDAPEEFWKTRAEEIAWFRPPGRILERKEGNLDVWFSDGELNTAWLAVDVHVENGRGDEIALIYDSPVTDSVRKISWIELRDEVARCAGALTRLGVGKGDRVIIYMPMIPEAVVSMLACARIGAVHSVVFGGFAARELATRIDDAEPDILLSASCGIEFSNVIPYKPLIDEALAMARHKIDHCVVYQRGQCRAELNEGEMSWDEFMFDAEAVECVPLLATDPLYILYTSGTTGKPKGVVRDHGGHAVALRYSMEAVYGAGPGDVFWAASDVGWVVGHSYIVYAPLIAGCTSILYEGKPVRTPDAGAFWRVIAEHRVKVFFTAPTAFRAIRKEDPDARLMAKYDLSCLARLFVAGERTDPPTYHWLCDILDVPVIDHWWQTETGWPVAGNPMGIDPQPRKTGSAGVPIPGYDVRIFSPENVELGPGEEGDVVIRLPLPPGCLPTVWGDHDRFIRSYLQQHPGFYHTGDGGYRDEDGYIYIMGRTDDVINVAGHRLSTGEMEEVVAAHPAIAECAVIGIADEDKGQVPVGLLVLKDGVNIAPEELEAELVGLVRKEIGPIANFKRAAVVSRLPKTRSGKTLRQIMRRIADNQEFETPATIDDPLILDEIGESLREAGIGQISGKRESS